MCPLDLGTAISGVTQQAQFSKVVRANDREKVLEWRIMAVKEKSSSRNGMWDPWKEFTFKLVYFCGLQKLEDI